MSGPGAGSDVALGDLLNAQTGRLSWPELTPHFARGVVVCVDSGEDLVAVAGAFVEDRAADMEALFESGRVHRAMDSDAIRWQETGVEFWAVVVAPWVLVQERS